MTNVNVNIEDTKVATKAKIYKNAFDNGETSYARIERDRCGMGTIIARLKSKNKLLDEATLLALFMQTSDVVMELVGEGHSVDLLGAGYLYLANSGAISSENPTASDVSNVIPKFTASAALLNVAKNVTIASVETIVTDAVIKTVKNCYTGTKDNTVTIDRTVKFEGSRIKLDGDSEDVGIYFVPASLDEDFENIGDNWIKVSKVLKTTPSTAEFYAPKELTEGNYFIVMKIGSRYVGKTGAKIKTVVYGEKVKAIEA